MLVLECLLLAPFFGAGPVIAWMRGARGRWDFLCFGRTVSNFFAEWTPVTILDRLLHKMDLQLCDHPVRRLGSGRLGTAFEVRRRDATASDGCMALKVVVGVENIRRLEREYMTNREVCRCVKGIIIEAVSLCKLVEGAGLLLKEVGTWVSITEPGSLLKALRALQRLRETGIRTLYRMQNQNTEYKIP